MMTIGILFCALGAVSGTPKQIVLDDVKHVTVYYEAGRFGGWSANHGIWI